jgi:hypothetical protein
LSSWPVHFCLKELVDISRTGYKKLQETGISKAQCFAGRGYLSEESWQEYLEYSKGCEEV